MFGFKSAAALMHPSTTKGQSNEARWFSGGATGAHPMKDAPAVEERATKEDEKVLKLMQIILWGPK